MSAHQNQFEIRGAKLAAVGLGDLHFARQFIAETGLTFPLLVDDKREAYRAVRLKEANIFHLFKSANTEARKRAKAAGHRQHGIKKNPFQLGGSFVFGPGNTDRFAHVAETFGDNAPISLLLAALP